MREFVFVDNGKKVVFETKGKKNKDAITIAKETDISFFVMGTFHGELFDPFAIDSNINEKDKERGGKKFFLRRCSKGCFTQYASYLNSRNKTSLRIAERKMKDE